jgi:glycosyltransferase involved in cell wall biosynthesis
MADRTEARWLSVVTVSRYEDETLARTLGSIEAQSESDVEPVVVLGDEPTEELQCRVEALGGVLVRQRPEGVYPAMNEGWGRSTGMVVHFLNAGDTYVNGSVLGAVRVAWDAAPFDWAYGRMVVVDPESGRQRLRGVTLAQMKSHNLRPPYFPELPTVFFRRAVLERAGGFDSSFGIAADYRLMLSVARASAGRDMSMPLTRYELGGLSDQRWVQSVLECHRARAEEFGHLGWRSGLEWAHSGVALSREGLRRMPRKVRAAIRHGRSEGEAA